MNALRENRLTQINSVEELKIGDLAPSSSHGLVRFAGEFGHHTLYYAQSGDNFIQVYSPGTHIVNGVLELGVTRESRFTPSNQSYQEIKSIAEGGLN